LKYFKYQKCTTCNLRSDLLKCHMCDKHYCQDHVLKCSLCERLCCLDHRNSFHDNNNLIPKQGVGNEILCFQGKEYEKYVGRFLNSKRHGCGEFTWPNGLKTLREYNNGNIIAEREITPEKQVQLLLEQERKKWDEEKCNKEKELQEFIKNEKERIAKELSLQKEKLDKEISASKEVILNERKELEAAKLAIEASKLAFEEEKNRMAKIYETQTGLVKLNIGGKIVQTSVTTLTSKSHMFQSMFSGRFAIQKDENNAIFLDRDGTNFDIILNYLRGLPLPNELSKTVLNAVLEETKFYQVAELEKLIQLKL